MPEPASSLYDRLGGAPAVEAAVRVFYSKVLADPSLAPVFEGIDTARLTGHQTAFLTVAFGGPDRYTGRALRTVHAGLGLTDAEFDAVAHHLEATLDELGVPAAEYAEVMKIVGSTRDDVLNR